MTFKTRLILIFLTSSLVPMLLLQVYLVGRYSRQQKEKISVLITSNLAQKKDNLEREVEDFRNLILSLMTEETFTETIHSAVRADPDKRALLLNQLEVILSQTTYKKKGLAGLIYCNPKDGIIINYNKFLIEDEDVFFNADGMEKAIESIELNGGSITTLPTAEMLDISQIPRSILLMGARFSDLVRTEWRGYIFLLINEDEIHDLLNPPNPNNTEIFSYTFLQDSTGHPYSFNVSGHLKAAT